MSEDNKNNEKDPLLLDHNYDGIQELDNPLPKWWLVTFYGTIIFGALYWVHYHSGGFGLSSDEALKKDLSEIREKQEKVLAQAPTVSEEDIQTLLASAEAVEAGKAEFIAKCASCHGNMGQGIIGPNLTDSHWISGDGSLKSIAHVITAGTENGMPPWKGLISQPMIHKVTAYIASIKGSNPEGAKAAEGQLFE